MPCDRRRILRLPAALQFPRGDQRRGCHQRIDLREQQNQQGDLDHCNVSADNARSCASDLSALACSATDLPQSCVLNGFGGGYVALSSSGGTSSGSTSSGGTSSGFSSGGTSSGGDDAGAIVSPPGEDGGLIDCNPSGNSPPVCGQRYGTTPAFYGCQQQSDCVEGTVCIDNDGDNAFYCKPLCIGDTSSCEGFVSCAGAGCQCMAPTNSGTGSACVIALCANGRSSGIPVCEGPGSTLPSTYDQLSCCQ